MSVKQPRVTKNCVYCEKEFQVRETKDRPGKFCSQHCQRKGRYHKPEVLVTSTCLTCEKEFTQPKHWKSPGKYCSIPCMAKARGESMRGENHHNWKGGNERTGCQSICDRLKKEIGKCQRCGSEKNLQSHHKIKVSDRPDLSCDPENIEILCVECHANEHPEFKGMLLKVKSGSVLNCEICGEEFYVKKSKLATARYCSRKCQHSGLRKDHAVEERKV